ncbi:MAG: hypothetical protein ABSA78_18990 [Candidatus Sulfotelmatobacter sp.]|jgi:hypothetical protein
MTQEEQEAITGRVALEHAQVGREIAALKAVIDQSAELFSRLSVALRQPCLIRFDGESLPEGTKVFDGFRPTDESAFSSSVIDGKRLKALCSELKEKTIKQRQLAQRMKELGL